MRIDPRATAGFVMTDIRSATNLDSQRIAVLFDVEGEGYLPGSDGEIVDLIYSSR